MPLHDLRPSIMRPSHPVWHRFLTIFYLLLLYFNLLLLLRYQERFIRFIRETVIQDPMIVKQKHHLFCICCLQYLLIFCFSFSFPSSFLPFFLFYFFKISILVPLLTLFNFFQSLQFVFWSECMLTLPCNSVIVSLDGNRTNIRSITKEVSEAFRR